MNQENGQNRQEQQNKQSASGWTMGASSAVGAAVGVVSGNAVQSAMAAEPVVAPDVQPNVQPEVKPDVQPDVQPDVKPDVKPENTHPNVTPDVPADEPTVTLVAHDTVVNEDGMPMDMALFNVDGTEVAAVDVDCNGTVDVVISDLNGDGTISNDEIMDVSTENVLMADLVNGVSGNAGEDQTLLADNNDVLPDYTNDGDVSGFMA